MGPKLTTNPFAQSVGRQVLKRNFDLAILALVIGGFAFVAAQRLGTVPLPDTDESMMLQISYEMLNRGTLAFPMKRFYGGDIENAWHSLTPVSFVTLSGFLKLFGWGLAQGRAFNLITAVLVLLMTYVIARKLFCWPVALIAIALMISDPLFLMRSRLVRYDLIATAFGLLAFYLYERAEERKGNWWYAASGLAAGLGVMCHTNLLYMLAAIAVLMLLRDGWNVIRTAKPYVFAAGAFAAMAYEIIYAIVDYNRFMVQTSKDNVHFGVLSKWGWWHNLLAERVRYVDWFNAGGAKIAPRTLLLELFLLLTIAAVLYLIARSLVLIKRKSAMSEPRVRLLVTTLVIVAFFALVSQRKVTQYVVHLAPWFAICVGVLLRDAAAQVRRLGELRSKLARPAYGIALSVAALVVVIFGYELFNQNRIYLAEVRDPNQASFDEMTAAIRGVVPDGLCPASIAGGYWWLAFPEYDGCFFAYIEAPLDESLDLDGKDYALILKPKFEGRLQKLTGGGFEKYHLLGELNRTALGTFQVYYTGNDPRFLALKPKRYYFLGHQRGYVSDDQILAAREAWSASGAELESVATNTAPMIEPDDQGSPIARSTYFGLCNVELDDNTIYQLSADATCRGECELLIEDDSTGAMIERIQTDRAGHDQLAGLFKTSSSRRIRLTLRLSDAQPADALPISRISIRAVAPAS
jgi:4-amino-4-deoxy-L-arabinose transferase-like glycosyltransferase